MLPTWHNIKERVPGREFDFTFNVESSSYGDYRCVSESDGNIVEGLIRLEVKGKCIVVQKSKCGVIRFRRVPIMIESTGCDCEQTIAAASTQLNDAQLKFVNSLQCVSQSIPRNFKGGIGSLFDACVNAVGRRPYWPSPWRWVHVDLLYLRIWRDHSARSAPILIIVWFTARQPVSARDLSLRGKGNSRLTKLLGGLNCEKKNPEVQ